MPYLSVETWAQALGVISCESILQKEWSRNAIEFASRCPPESMASGYKSVRQEVSP